MITESQSQTDTTTAGAAATSGSSSSIIETCSFSIVVRTANTSAQPARANLFVQGYFKGYVRGSSDGYALTDAMGRQNDKIRLKCSVTHRRKFQPGHCDLFVLADQVMIEDIKSIEVWHQKREPGNPLPLHSITVLEHSSHTAYHFDCAGQKLGAEAAADRTMTSAKFGCIGSAPVFRK
ncbi:hypothetical protein PRIPAC_75583 [Pristionchus pacificus]|uniref:Uncharacterized protein n=1 Tax=Pristionchus pacificus TaxID=54126 RepID=A0A2A6C8Q1_PRIPA|nr:hypothetical protein PRIPAC_75583 [Pristionchus pacificus]|eukprot:PDM74458.1 hypothetical protein PRIPAC_41814 [Pristionchus pacificus]